MPLTPVDKQRALMNKTQPLYNRVNSDSGVDRQIANFKTDRNFIGLPSEEKIGQDIDMSGLGQPTDSVPSAQLTQREGLPPITQTFGQKSQYDVFSGGVNYGVDYGVKEGTPVGLPAGSWKVLDAYNQASGQGYIGNKQNSGYGNSVLVRNTKTGETLRLSHLSRVGVRPGQVIPGGTVIATSGSTGNVTGPHLDVEYKDSRGRLGDVLRTPYATSLVGAGGGNSLGRGGGFIDNIRSGAEKFVQGFRDRNAEARNREYNQKAIYGDDMYRNSQFSRFPVLPNLDWQSIDRKANRGTYPGQTMARAATGFMAGMQAKDPRYQGLQNMDRGLPITPGQKSAIETDAIVTVGGATQPISKSRLPRNRFIDAQGVLENGNPNQQMLAHQELDLMTRKFANKSQQKALEKIKLPAEKLKAQLSLLDEVVPQLPKQQAVSSLAQEAKKYDQSFNLNNPDDVNYLKRVFSVDRVEDMKKGDFSGNYTKERVEEILNANLIQDDYVKPVLKTKPYKGTDTFYHGTSPENIEPITQQGFKIGSDLPEDAFRSGGYGEMQQSVSLSSDPQKASIFTGSGSKGGLIETKIKPGSKIVEAKGIDDAIELNDYLDQLKSEGIDAVWIGGGEKELVVINPSVIETTRSTVFDVMNGKKQVEDFYNQAKGIFKK